MWFVPNATVRIPHVNFESLSGSKRGVAFPALSGAPTRSRMETSNVLFQAECFSRVPNTVESGHGTTSEPFLNSQRFWKNLTWRFEHFAYFARGARGQLNFLLKLEALRCDMHMMFSPML